MNDMQAARIQAAIGAADEDAFVAVYLEVSPDMSPDVARRAAKSRIRAAHGLSSRYSLVKGAYNGPAPEPVAEG